MEELSFTDEEIEELSKSLPKYQIILKNALGVDVINLLGEGSPDEIISQIMEKFTE